MAINGLGPIKPITPDSNVGLVGKGKAVPPKDSISISTEAAERSEQLRVMKIALAAPDVREDRVAELRARINDPNYINETVLRGTADRLIDALFG